MKGRKLVEVTVTFAGKTILQPADQRLLHSRHIVFHLSQRIDRQIPARIMGDGNGVIERIAAVEQGLMTVFPPQDKKLIEPCHMPDFPDRRVKNRQFGSHKLFRRQPFQQFQRALTGTLKCERSAVRLLLVRS